MYHVFTYLLTFWPGVSVLLFFESPAFRNEAIYMKSKTNSGSVNYWLTSSQNLA